MTVNGLEKGCVLEFIEKHQRAEAHHVKEWNKSAEKIAVTTDENTKAFFIEHKEQSRRRLVVEQETIKEFALLIGKRTKHVDIRTPTDLLEVKSVEVI